MANTNQFVHIFGYPNTSVVVGKTEKGRTVEIYLPHKVITDIAKYITPENQHVGHAIWHSQNQQSKFPCETCTPNNQ